MSIDRRRLAAIMFTDMVGYTALAQRNESLSLELAEEQRKIIRPIISRNRGREVKTMGDAFLVEFPSALDAVRAAFEIQKTTRERYISATADRKLLLRIGIHLGDVVESSGDISGDAVNIASRIQTLADGGGVCITRQVYDQVQNKFEQPLLSMGAKPLKNVIMPVEVYRVKMPWESGNTLTSQTQLDKKRIAVIPFANISPNPTDEYFADGMTEELIATLSRIRDLGVIARTSVIRYKGLTKPVAEIGRELNVGTVLEGSVRVAGKKLRITAQLIDVKNEEHLWSETYDRELEDALAIQSDLAKRIAKALKIRILPESLRLDRKAPGTPEAYSLYLRGRHSLGTRTEKSLKEAIHHFENVIKRDPSFALAYTGLADAYSILASYSVEYIPPREGFPKAKTAAEKALSLDGHLAEAHASLGLVRFYYDWDWNGAETEFKKAIELNPGYAQAHQYYADFVKSFGRFDEALAEMAKALALDPLSYSINTGIGHVLYLSRKYDLAIEHYGKVVESDPAFVPARLWFGRPYMQKGMFNEALEQSKEAVKLSNDSTVSLATLGQAYAAAGQKGEAAKILNRLLERSKKQYVPSYWIALVNMSMGNLDEAMNWLERAYIERSSWLVWANVEPRFDTLRSDPRFSALLARIGFRK